MTIPTADGGHGASYLDAIEVMEEMAITVTHDVLQVFGVAR